MEQTDAFLKIWKLQGELFVNQKELIEWLIKFLPSEEVPNYNLKILKVNYILGKIRELEDKIREELKADA
jgi:hypothetical protein